MAIIRMILHKEQVTNTLETIFIFSNNVFRIIMCLMSLILLIPNPVSGSYFVIVEFFSALSVYINGFSLTNRYKPTSGLTMLF